MFFFFFSRRVFSLCICVSNWFNVAQNYFSFYREGKSKKIENGRSGALLNAKFESYPYLSWLMFGLFNYAFSIAYVI
jgi:hypothetical protein